MRRSYNVHSIDLWHSIKNLALGHELLLEHRELGRLGCLDSKQLSELAIENRAHGGRNVLVWDILASDAQIQRADTLLHELDLSIIDAIRVQDPGVAMYVSQSWPLPLQLVLETGNHNIGAILSWIDVLGDAVERIILSNELPISWTLQYRDQIAVEVELAVLSPILIFYSPRPLIGTRVPEPDQPLFWGEPGQRRLPVKQNQHGTFLFYEKALFLLPHWQDIRAARVDVNRYDLRLWHSDALVDTLIAWHQEKDTESSRRVRDQLTKRTTQGFFKSNRTDKQFAKLKRHDSVPEGLRPAGLVVDTRKKSYTLINLQEAIRVGQTLVFVNSIGETTHHQIRWIEDLDRQRHSVLGSGLAIIDHVSRAPTGTNVYMPVDDETFE